MAAPIPPAAAPANNQLNGIAGYDTATYVKERGETIVTLKKKDGTKEYAITLTFFKPIDEANIRSYIAAKETKEKIDHMVQQYVFFAPVYGGKKDFKVESIGYKTQVLFTSKKGMLKRLDMTEEDFQKTFNDGLQAYQQKIDKARTDKKDEREKKFTAKKEAFRQLSEKFKPLSKNLKAPGHPDPKQDDPAFKVAEANPAPAPAAPAPPPATPAAPAPAAPAPAAPAQGAAPAAAAPAPAAKVQAADPAPAAPAAEAKKETVKINPISAFIRKTVNSISSFIKAIWSKIFGRKS